MHCPFLHNEACSPGVLACVLLACLLSPALQSQLQPMIGHQQKLLVTFCRSWRLGCGPYAGSCQTMQTERRSSGARLKPSPPATLGMQAWAKALARWIAEAGQTLLPSGSAWMTLSTKKKTGICATEDSHPLPPGPSPQSYLSPPSRHFT